MNRIIVRFDDLNKETIDKIIISSVDFDHVVTVIKGVFEDTNYQIDKRTFDHIKNNHEHFIIKKK